MPEGRRACPGRARAWIQRGVLALAAILTLWALQGVRPVGVVLRLGAGVWLATGGLVLLSTLLAYLPSWIFLRAAGHRISFSGFSAIMLASQAVNASNPLRMGFPMRVYFLRDRYGVPLATASFLIPFEAFMTVVVAALCALVTAPFLVAGPESWWKLALGLASGAACLAAMGAGRMAARGRMPGPRWLPERAQRVWNALQTPMARVTPATLGLFGALFLASDLAIVGIMKVAGQSSGFDASLPFLLGACSVSYLVGVISFMPQGLGTRDAALGFLLHAGGATPEQATGLVLLVRLATTGFTFVAGLIAASLLGVSRAPVPAAGPRRGHIGIDP